MTRAEEYKSIRDEMREWQARRFLVLSACASIVSAALALDLVKGDSAQGSWALLTSVLLLVLAASAALIWYCAHANVVAAEYLIRFHETRLDAEAQWEVRLRARPRGGHLNWFVAIFLLVLAGMSVLIPLQASLIPPAGRQAVQCCQGDKLLLTPAGASAPVDPTASYGLAVFSGLVFLFPLLMNFVGDFGRTKAREDWQRIWSSAEGAGPTAWRSGSVDQIIEELRRPAG